MKKRWLEFRDSDYEGVLNIVRAAGEARDDGEFALCTLSVRLSRVSC